MKPSLEQRIADLENMSIHAQAVAVFQAAATSALVDVVAVVSGSVDVRPAELRIRTEERLANISDDAPRLASELRSILQSELDRPSGRPT